VLESNTRDLNARQKLSCAIARALLAEPRILLIDDRGVDEKFLVRIREAFAGPVLLVTADFDLCHAAVDELILLEAGRIVQRGPAREVIENPESIQAARILGIANIFEA